MRIPTRFPLFLLLAGLFSAQALAGAGQTSAGVTTTVGNQNEPSADVQQQSSGFVQQNQQLANAPPTPGAGASASGAAAQGTTQAATAVGAQTGNKANTPAVNGVAVAAPPTPATPPPPPPTYESTMRRIERHDPTPKVIASGPPGAVRKQDPAEPPKPARPPPASAPAPTVSTPANIAAAGRAENATAQAPSERVVPVAAPGGRGEAPDGFTFYSGVSIAGALLAFAFATFLRMGRSET